MIAALVGFMMGFIGSMPIVGPVSSLVFHRGLGGRYWDGWAIGVGGALAEGVYCAVAIQGFTALHGNLPFSTTLARAMAVLLLLAVGVYFILVARAHPTDPQPLRKDRWSRLNSFIVGMSAAAANPTLLLTWSASVAMVLPITNLTLQGHAKAVFPASVIAGIATWFSLLLILLHRLRHRFPFPAYRAATRGIGVALVTLAISSAAWTVYSFSGGIP